MSSLSPMQLKDFVIQLLHIEANPNFHAHDGARVTDKLDIDFQMKERRGGGQFRIDLDVNVNGQEAQFKKCAYRIHTVVYALFEFDRDTPKDEADKLLGLNGVAMAYSIARGIVADATGTSLHEKYLLPTVNFVDLMREKTGKSGKKAPGRKSRRDRTAKEV